MHKIVRITVCLGFIALAFAGCTKTEYNYLKRPYHDIKLFSLMGSYGDSINALVRGDSIVVYWNPDVELPTTITPDIMVADQATISPASGVAVPFNEQTRYTVTAEDGTTKTYRLKIALTVPFPVIKSATNPISWLSTSQITIAGEYFLANTDTSEISAYLQRQSDGFEVPLEIMTRRVTNFQIVASLPPFSAEQDTGMHKLFVQTGSRLAREIDVRFLMPTITNTTYTSSLVEDGQPVRSGDMLTVNFTIMDNYDGKIANYYKNGINEVLLYTMNYDIITVPHENLTVTDGSVTFKVPDVSSHVGKSLFQYRLTFKSVPEGSEQSSAYSLRGFITGNTPLSAE